MNKGAPPHTFVALKHAEPRLKRDKIVKVRLDPKELYLLDEADKKLNNGNRARTIRDLIARFDEIDRARRLAAAFDRVGLAKAELATLLAAEQSFPADPEFRAKGRGPGQ